jgi:hypothetical protein
MSAPWFDPNEFGMWFGILAGGVGGSRAGLFGALAGTLAPQGKGRTCVLGAMGAFLGMGLVLVALGLVALVCGQPFGIWFWPVFAGADCALLFGLLTPVIRRRYAEAEERRLEGEALRRG